MCGDRIVRGYRVLLLFPCCPDGAHIAVNYLLGEVGVVAFQAGEDSASVTLSLGGLSATHSMLVRTKRTRCW